MVKNDITMGEDSSSLFVGQAKHAYPEDIVLLKHEWISDDNRAVVPGESTK